MVCDLAALAHPPVPIRCRVPAGDRRAASRSRTVGHPRPARTRLPSGRFAPAGRHRRDVGMGRRTPAWATACRALGGGAIRRTPTP